MPSQNDVAIDDAQALSHGRSDFNDVRGSGICAEL
jgi:hypothetical protein